MEQIIYIDGTLADDMGSQYIQEILDSISHKMKRPICALTQGKSEFHGYRRYIGNPEANPVKD